MRRELKIPGIKKRTSLKDLAIFARQFASIDAIATASVEELASAEGVGMTIAESVREWFSVDWHREIVEQAHRRGVKVRVAPRATELIIERRGEYVPGQGVPLFELRPPVFAGADWVVKRGFDQIVSTIVAIVGLPFWLLIALAIKLDSPGPVLFRDRRVGLNERDFGMFKFRTMYADAEARQAEARFRGGDERPLLAFLLREFGNEWFAKRDAGDLLQELWSLGQAPTADEMLKHVTGSTLESRLRQCCHPASAVLPPLRARGASMLMPTATRPGSGGSPRSPPRSA